MQASFTSLKVTLCHILPMVEVLVKYMPIKLIYLSSAEWRLNPHTTIHVLSQFQTTQDTSLYPC